MNTLFIPIHMLLEALFPLLPTPQALAKWAVGSVLVILAVLALRLALKGRLSCRVRYALWGVVLVRLLIPAQLPLSLPLSPAQAVPSTPAAWEESTVPVFPSIPQDFAGTDPYYQTFEPGQLGPTEGSMGYVQRSEDGETVTTYLDLYTPAQMVQILWLVGAVLVLIVFLWSNLRFHRRLCKRRKLLTDADSPIPVYVAEGLPSPCLFGLFRPAIYLTPQELEEPLRSHVLAHELTHHDHRDHIWSVLRVAALALHWYDPLVWLAVVRSKEDGELACDEGAVLKLGESQRLAYGKTLVDMVAQGSARPLDLLSASTTMTQGRKPLQERIAQLVSKPQTRRVAALCAAAVVVLAGVLAFTGGREEAPYDTLMTRVEGTQSIRFTPPLYSSMYYPDPIADEELLAQAKELLSQGKETDWDTPGSLMMAPSILLDTEDGMLGYRLCQEEDLTYIVDIGTDRVAAVYDFDLANRLEQLAREQTDVNGTIHLDQEVWYRLRAFFEDQEGQVNFAKQFLTSYYERPENIDLFELFYLGGSVPEEASREERQSVLDAAYGGVDPDCGCTKISRAQMDADLMTYLGLTLEETAQVGLEKFTYLAEYDAYYHFHGDTNAPGNITLYTNTPQENLLSVYYQGQGPGTMLLRETQDGFQFVAHRNYVPSLYNSYQDTVELAETIRVSPPPVSGEDWPLIADPVLVEEMRDILQRMMAPTGEEDVVTQDVYQSAHRLELNRAGHREEYLLWTSEGTTYLLDLTEYGYEVAGRYASTSLVFALEQVAGRQADLPLVYRVDHRDSVDHLARLVAGDSEFMAINGGGSDITQQLTGADRLEFRFHEDVKELGIEESWAESMWSVEAARGDQSFRYIIPWHVAFQALGWLRGDDYARDTMLANLTQLTAAGIQGVSGRLADQAGVYDAEGLARMIREGLAEPVEGAEVWELWSLNLTLTSGQIVRFTAGEEADLVAVEGRTFRSPELYQFIRQRWTPDPGAVVEADMTPDMENLVNSILQGELMHRNGQTPGSPYTDAKLTAFRRLSDHPDLVEGAVVRLYEFDYGFTLDDLTKAGWAGGNYVDGNLLFHPHEMALHLVTVERDGLAGKATFFPWEYLLEEGGPGWDGPVTREEIEEAVVNELWDLLSPEVPAQLTDPQAVAEAYGQALADRYLSLGSAHPKAVNSASFLSAELYAQGEDALCATITLAVDPVEPMTAHWMSGNGLDQVDGQWRETLDYCLQRRSDGTWRCVDWGTGGVRLPEA